jgi:AcrR family transcriptional regulator
MTSRVPQRADAQRNRERLLTAAETAFNARGAGASLDDIAKAAGVGNATLYRHFPTRAKLLEAVYDQRIAELCAAAAELAEPAAPARALHEWLRAVVAHVTDRRVLTDAFLAAYEGPADIEPPQFAAWHDALFAAGRPLLAAAQDAGTARRDLDIAELLALVTGVARAGSPAQAERFLSVLLEGITPRLPLAGTPGIFRHGWGEKRRPESRPGPFEITGLERRNGRPPPRSSPASRKSLAIFV